MTHIEVSYRVRKESLYPVIFSIFCFILSYCFFPYYFGGDQQFYNKFYGGISGYGLFDGFIFYNNSLGTKEPFYYLIVYFFSGWTDRVFFVSLANSLLAFLIYRNIVRLRVVPLYYFLIFFNFYILVLFFSAERLKFGVLFFLLALEYKREVRLVFFLLAVLTHVQVIFLVVAVQAANLIIFFKLLARLSLRASYLHLLFGLFALSFVGYFLKDHIISKLQFYSAVLDISSILKPMFFLFWALLYAKNRRVECFLAALPMVFASFFIGDERVNIFMYFLFSYYAFQFKKGVNFPSLMFAIYYTFTGCTFLYLFYNYGDGFVVS